MVTGGVARPQTYELVGPLTEGVLHQVVLDVAVLGVDGVDPQLGVMTHHEDEAGISRLFAERARKVILATDSSKMGKRAFARICGLEESTPSSPTPAWTPTWPRGSPKPASRSSSSDAPAPPG